MRCDASRATTAAKENCREISSSLNRSSLGSCEVDFGGGALISFMAMKVQAITAGGGVGLLCPLGVGSSGSYSQSCSVQFSVSGRVSAISCRTGGGLSPTQRRVGTKKKLRFLENELLGKQVVSFKSRCPTTHKKPSRFLVRASAVFDNLSSSFEAVWTKLRNQDVLTRENIKEPMQDIRRALLEADVSLPVVRKFVKTVTEKAIGIGVIKGVRPDQQLVKVVNDELITLMGGTLVGIEYAKSGPTVILMAGLQGVGKTTACAKLALYFKKKSKSVMMVATDIYRPAAIDQLVTLGRQVEVPVFEAGTSVKPAEIAKRGLAEAKVQGIDVIIIDTAGRLQVDRGMMDELKDVKRAVSPTEVLLVVDAMTGQEAAALVSAFNLDLGITGAILTKLDGDSRGGAALSVKEVSGKPIKFVGEGESMAALEQFYPDRMASRILGMGDVLSFVEKAQEVMVKEEAEDMQRRIMEAKFDFNDFLKQTRNLARMGSMGGLMKLIPGMNKISPQQIAEAEKSLKVMESMINSMTPKERGDPELLAKSPSRRRRVALGSGRSQEQVSQLVSQLFQMRARMKNLSSMMQGGSIPGLGALEEQLSGRKAPPGTAKRRKPKGGLQVSGPSRSAAKGFGSK